MITLWLAAALLIQDDYLGLPKFDPRAPWKTLETPHFSIHYEEEIDAIAERAAKIFEEAHLKLSAKFQSQPSGKVHVVLNDASDESNGLSTPMPYNTVYLFIAPPSEFSSLDYYDDWLRMLIFHEYTHTLHLDQAEGINKFLRVLFGRFIIPNAGQQQWAHEGLAELNETMESSKGRGRSPFTDALIRAAILENRFLPIHRATYWHDRYPFGNAAYVYGVKFYQYLVEKYGETKVYDLTRETARWPIPAFLNFKTKSVFGKSLTRLWNEWQKELEVRYAGLTTEAPSPRRWLRSQERLEGWGSWSDNGQIFYAPVSSLVEGKQIVAFDFSKGFSKPERRLIKAGGAPARLQLFKNKLYYAKSAEKDRYHHFSDLYEYDLTTKKEKRLTRGLRLTDAFADESGLWAVRTHHLQSSVVRLPVASLEKDKQEIDSLTDWETLFKAPPEAIIGDIAVRGDRLVFSMRHSEGRWIFVKNLKSGDVQRLSSLDECMHPAWASDHEILTTCYETIQLASDAPREKAKNQISETVSRLQIFDLQSGERRILSHPLTSDDLPSQGKNYLAFGRLSSEGYKLEFQESLPTLQTTALTLAAADLQAIEAHSPSTVYAAKPSVTLSKGDYNSHSALLPHYLFPFFFYTESDLALGAFSASHDPLQWWSWAAQAYYLSSPQRPGGSLSVGYQGLAPVTLFGIFQSSISDLGNIMAVTSGTSLGLSREHYFEHSYGGALGVSWEPHGRKGRWPFSLSLLTTFERTSSLFDLPSNLLSGRRTITNSLGASPITYRNVLGRPETGNQYGVSLSLSSTAQPIQASDDISPTKGIKWDIGTDYAPIFKNNRDSLVTTASLRGYFEIFRDSFVAAKVSGGGQWFDAAYQRSFRLGGAFGESPFSAVNKRVYALRGLDSGSLRGEGILHGQFEYRAAILKSFPGFGTAPIWLKDLSLGLFSDVGQVFRIRKNTVNAYEAIINEAPESLSWKHWSQSVGLELRSPISLSYGPPLLFRAGYGQALYRKGEWVGNSRMSETYLSLGSSF